MRYPRQGRCSDHHVPINGQGGSDTPPICLSLLFGVPLVRSSSSEHINNGTRGSTMDRVRHTNEVGIDMRRSFELG